MPGQQNDGKMLDLRMAAAHLEERREVRYDVPIEIEVSGIDQNAQVFHERTFTRNVSEWGCAFLLSVELKADDIVSLRVASPDTRELATERQSLFQVLRVTREAGGWLVGAWKMDSEDVWGIDLEKIAAQEEGVLNSDKGAAARHREHPLKDLDR